MARCQLGGPFLRPGIRRGDHRHHRLLCLQPHSGRWDLVPDGLRGARVRLGVDQCLHRCVHDPAAHFHHRHRGFARFSDGGCAASVCRSRRDRVRQSRPVRRPARSFAVRLPGPGAAIEALRCTPSLSRAKTGWRFGNHADQFVGSSSCCGCGGVGHRHRRLGGCHRPGGSRPRS